MNVKTESRELGWLADEIKRIIKLCKSTVGVGIVHIESGLSWYNNREVSFPMASTYKIPIAMKLLKDVESGVLVMEDMISIKQYDQHPGSGILSELIDNPGLSLSIANLFELMMTISDNTATDIILSLVGGGGAVTDYLKSLEITGMTVDRSTLEMLSDFAGMKTINATDRVKTRIFDEYYEKLSDQERKIAEMEFLNIHKDVTTPEAMSRLLGKIMIEGVLNRTHIEILLDAMRKNKYGDDRIKGFLPPHVIVAHKTGTLGTITNDAGILTLPNDLGHIALVVLIKKSDDSNAEREATIAHIARATYDYFVFFQSKYPGNKNLLNDKFTMGEIK